MRGRHSAVRTPKNLPKAPKKISLYICEEFM